MRLSGLGLVGNERVGAEATMFRSQEFRLGCSEADCLDIPEYIRVGIEPVL